MSSRKLPASTPTTRSRSWFKISAWSALNDRTVAISTTSLQIETHWKVDAAVFCMDVGWRKPHRAPFDRALSLLEVAPADALFVGDDHRWDIVGAQNAGLRPVLLESVVPRSPRDHPTIPNLAGVLALLAEASL
jgi:phosphoglycolate phosphatase-like HAD superfamily hydrolase